MLRQNFPYTEEICPPQQEVVGLMQALGSSEEMLKRALKTLADLKEQITDDSYDRWEESSINQQNAAKMVWVLDDLPKLQDQLKTTEQNLALVRQRLLLLRQKTNDGTVHEGTVRVVLDLPIRVTEIDLESIL